MSHFADLGCKVVNRSTVDHFESFVPRRLPERSPRLDAREGGDSVWARNGQESATVDHFARSAGPAQSEISTLDMARREGWCLNRMNNRHDEPEQDAEREQTHERRAAANAENLNTLVTWAWD